MSERKMKARLAWMLVFNNKGGQQIVSSMVFETRSVAANYKQNNEYIGWRIARVRITEVRK